MGFWFQLAKRDRKRAPAHCGIYHALQSGLAYLERRVAAINGMEPRKLGPAVLGLGLLVSKGFRVLVNVRTANTEDYSTAKVSTTF